MRIKLLEEQTWNHISRLGNRAFETISGEVVNVVLIIITNTAPTDEQVMTGLDVSEVKVLIEKTNHLHSAILRTVKQAAQFHNPKTPITLSHTNHKTFFPPYPSFSQPIKPST